eukprot:3620559-Pyramimonas_sp.AAC.1
MGDGAGRAEGAMARAGAWRPDRPVWADLLADGGALLLGLLHRGAEPGPEARRGLGHDGCGAAPTRPRAREPGHGRPRGL